MGADLKSLWDELAAEAAFMQVQITEGRTTNQCVEDCENADNINRKRCARNCDQIADDGGDSNTRTFNCDDCRTMPQGGRRRERCMDACRQGQTDAIDECWDVGTCAGCRLDCGTGVALDNCLDKFNCPLDNRSDRRSCNSARTCGECNSFCSGDDLLDCRQDYCGNGNRNFDNNDNIGDCVNVRDCDNCDICSGRDRRQCEKRECSADQLAKKKLEGVFIQK